jgi:hypothetical protein
VLTKEFILELKKVRHMFEWNLTPDTGKFAERRATPRFHLRATVKDRPELGQFEPIGAVCFVRTNMAFTADYWVEAALSIGLPVQDARNIVAAANDLTWRTVGEVRKPDPYRQQLRTTLIETAGLQLPAIASQKTNAVALAAGGARQEL